VNRDEIKQILLVYRPGTSDADDPEIAEALALAQGDPELSLWLEEHHARQKALREKFRQLSVPAGLKEQIISEQAARAKAASRRERITGVAAVAVIVIALISIGVMLLSRNSGGPKPIPDTLAGYQGQMEGIARSIYYMDLLTNDPVQIQSFLAKNHAPSDYVLPAGLQKTSIAGCSVPFWQNSRGSMICFRTGKPLPPGTQSDLWLFVIDQSDVKGASAVGAPQFTQADGFITATWAKDGKLYLLTTRGDEQTIQKFL
jgi:hypothetical protein